MASSAIQLQIEIPSGAPLAALGPDLLLGVRTAIGRGANNRLIAHMDQLDQERANALGGKRTHFYGQVRDALSTHDPVVAGENVTISINQVGFAQRYFGGTILPTGSRTYLAIPARAEAHGKRPGDFSDLHFVKTRRGGMLVENDRQAVRIGSNRRKDGTRKVTPGAESGGGVMFWLVTEVTQKPDHSVLPAPEQILAAGVEAGTEYTELQLARAAGGRS